MQNYLAISSAGPVIYCGPLADSVEKAAENWYLHVCKIYAWSNDSENFAGFDHEQACDVYRELQRKPAFHPVSFPFFNALAMKYAIFALLLVLGAAHSLHMHQSQCNMEGCV